MKKVLSIGMIIIFLLVAASSFIMSLAAETAINTYAEMEARPAGPADRVLESRETPPQADPSDCRSSGAGLLALVIIAVLGLLAFLMFGERFLKQLRLATKPRKKRPSARTIQPVQPPQNNQTLQETPRPIREIPQWTETD